MMVWIIKGLTWQGAHDSLHELFPHHVEPHWLSAGPRINGQLPTFLWCRDQFGRSAVEYYRPGDHWMYRLHMDRRWGTLQRVYCFRDPDEAFHFKMRWG